MSGSGGGRSDGYFGGGGAGGGSGGGGGAGGLGPGGPVDPCSVSYRGPVNSPKAAVLGQMKVGEIMDVAVDKSGRSPILIVRSLAGAEAGSLTFNNYLVIIGCIDKGVVYKATIMNISGGVYEVSVDPQ